MATATPTATPATTAACAAKPALEDRRLLSPPEAARLAATFKVLASDSRLRLLHALARAGQLCVTDLAAQVGMGVPAVSNQLARLVEQRILAARRDGNRIYYRITDPCVTQLLELGWCLTEDTAAAAATAERTEAAR
jgi:DNA-binding transcriptional ArsR family regulator